MKTDLKRRLHSILSQAAEGDYLSRTFDVFLMGLISVNVLAVVFETVPGLPAQVRSAFRILEIFSVAVFTVEYASRLWTCTLDERFKNAIWGRIRFALAPLMLIDLLAILPFYLPMLIPCDLRFVRAIRLLRLVRLVKMGRYSRSLKLLGRVLANKKEEIFVTLFVGAIFLVVASSAVYLIERDVQPESFSSIPAAMWWGVTALTPVGSGGMAPMTTAGKLIGGVIAVLGIGMFALPAGILGSGFVEEIRKPGRKRLVCPHCGKEIAR
jgi:voltage-gated potassium channel